MINIIVVTHGHMAGGLMNAMELIIGRQEGIESVELNEMDSVDALEAKIDGLVQQLMTEEGVLILVDLFGASPFNASSRVAGRYDKVDVITGVSLPMLLETVLNRSALKLEELAGIAAAAGKDGVRIMKELLKQSS